MQFKQMFVTAVCVLFLLKHEVNSMLLEPFISKLSYIVLNISRCVSLAVVFDFSSFLFFKFG